MPEGLAVVIGDVDGGDESLPLLQLDWVFWARGNQHLHIPLRFPQLHSGGEVAGPDRLRLEIKKESQFNACQFNREAGAI